MTREYPTDAEIDALVRCTDSPEDFVQRVNDLWWHDGFRVYGPDPDEWGRKSYVCELSTWGWSGNEELVGALKRTWFWFFFWEQSRRGGHFTFQVPENQWRTPLPEPLPQWLEVKS